MLAALGGAWFVLVIVFLALGEVAASQSAVRQFQLDDDLEPADEYRQAY